MTPQPEQPSKSSGEAVLILGGSGFVGTRLTRLLRQRARPVRIGDVRQSAEFSSLWRACDVCDLVTLRPVVRGSSVIVNLAAEHRDDVRPVSLYHRVNVEGAARVCEAAREASVDKIIFTSSVAVYGFQPQPVDESGPFAPFNDYGRTKLEAEGIYQAWASEDPRRTLVIIRPTVVFGEGNRGNVYNLIHQIATGKFLMVGSGDNTKSIAYVGNVAAFLVYTLSLGPGTHVFNYVDGPDMRTGDLVGYIRGCLGKSGRAPRVPKSIAMAAGRVLDVLARLSGRNFPISAVRVRKFCETTQFRADRVRESGFLPPYSLQDALTRTIQFECLRDSCVDQKGDELIRTAGS